MNEPISWRKSKRSHQTTSCIEVGQDPRNMRIRDTKNRAGGTLLLDKSTFSAFLAAVKSDRLR
ncbi:DUF397 domain-containing protein [Actinoalloteichus hymeniacidonis]|uniref:DUF397 family protein n=1 Tax=Actinoalloteichus hymeniacidonis TaxID=340345 RepID=A0AAC9HLV9_9PSEU|nr:DUF397 domain-containing protein [Actinoalloteichus hymeniacidonis]AOS61206.1 putative DUF397 family protein [Actinoalloteichus hymeniacidonis]MBB5910792.1 hypothetical protein [Actinoalloteichus hymeniacidonis]